MTLEDLRVFVLVCELESLAAAARRLGRSQPAVSQHVRRLERELGARLLERTTTGVVPTPAGHALRVGASEALGTLSTSLRRLDALRQGVVGRVRVATGGTTVRHVMVTAIRAFRMEHPGVALELHSAASTERCLEAVRSDRADLAFVTMGPVHAGVEERAVVQSPWVLLVPGTDPRRFRSAVRPRDLEVAQVIALPERSTSQRLLAAALLHSGVALDPTASVDDWDTAALLVELGLGDAVVPTLHAAQLAQDREVAAVPIPWLPPVAFGWAARRFDRLDALARRFAELVREDLANRAGLSAPPSASG